MITFYVFALVLGGGFLGISLLGDLVGGHGDVDFSSDVALDGDISLDAHLDADAGALETDVGHTEVDTVHAGADGAGAHGSNVAAKVFSIRTVTYSLFGFGAVGTLLTYVFRVDAPGTVAAFAVTGGVLSGALINAAFGWVRRSESGAVVGEVTFSGHSGRVTLPVTPAGGKVVVEHLGKEVELRALPHPSTLGQGDPSTWTSVLVVEMKKGVAFVAPMERELLDE